jgi:predicted transcriptional regulator
MTPEQCRAARGWLDWTQVELAKRSKIGLSTVQDFEAGSRNTQTRKRKAIQAVLEKRGIRFLNSRTLGITFVNPSRKKPN